MKRKCKNKCSKKGIKTEAKLFHEVYNSSTLKSLTFFINTKWAKGVKQNIVGIIGHFKEGKSRAMLKACNYTKNFTNKQPK